ncbi:MAG: hypothetical protein R2726_19110 [Acidimicrobiales bacterium]
MADAGQVRDGGQGLAHQAHEGDQPAHREVALEDEPRTEAQDDHLQGGDHHLDRHPEDAAEQLELDLTVEEPVARLAEAGDLAGLEREGLDDRLGAVVLGGHREDRAGLLLHGDAALLGALGHGPVDEGDDRRAEQHDDGEQGVQEHQHGGRHGQGEDLDQALPQGLGQPLFEHAHVGEHPGEHVALLVPSVPALREVLHLGEHLDAQLADHRAADHGGEVGAAQPGQGGHHEGGAQHAEQLEHLGVLPARDGDVEEVPEHEGEDHGEGEPEHRVGEHLDLAAAVRAQVAQRHAQELARLHGGPAGQQLLPPPSSRAAMPAPELLLGGGVQPPGLGAGEHAQERVASAALDQVAHERQRHGGTEVVVGRAQRGQLELAQRPVDVGAVGDHEAVALQQRTEAGRRRPAPNSRAERPLEGAPVGIRGHDHPDLVARRRRRVPLATVVVGRPGRGTGRPGRWWAPRPTARTRARPGAAGPRRATAASRPPWPSRAG